MSNSLTIFLNNSKSEPCRVLLLYPKINSLYLLLQILILLIVIIVLLSNSFKSLIYKYSL